MFRKVFFNLFSKLKLPPLPSPPEYDKKENDKLNIKNIIELLYKKKQVKDENI